MGQPPRQRLRPAQTVPGTVRREVRGTHLKTERCAHESELRVRRQLHPDTHVGTVEQVWEADALEVPRSGTVDDLGGGGEKRRHERERIGEQQRGDEQR